MTLVYAYNFSSHEVGCSLSFTSDTIIAGCFLIATVFTLAILTLHFFKKP